MQWLKNTWTPLPIVAGVVVPFASDIGKQYHFLVVDASCSLKEAQGRRWFLNWKSVESVVNGGY